MYKGLVDLHSVMRWVVLLTGLYAIIKGASGYFGKKKFVENADKKAGLFFMISCDIQLLVGVALYLMSRRYSLFTIPEAMKISESRFFGLEHALGMVIAIFLAHATNSVLKKNISDEVKFKRMFWYALISVILIIAFIPWPFRHFPGHTSLFPGMQ